MQRYLAVAVDAARAAGRLQRERLGSVMAVAFKGEINLVTEVDRESEELIVGMLRAACPDSDIVAEENDYGARRTNLAWIVDPLDGTTNFAHGFPWFAVSIALEVDGEIRVGVVYHPCLDELFTAVRGEGAFLNGRRLAVSDRAPLKSCLLATGFPYDRTWDNENNFDNFCRFQMAARGVRRFGAAALDLAYVAAGRLDGYWECKLKPWDVAAGRLLVEEAGGRMSNHVGEAFSIYDHRILASNGLVHEEMRGLLQRDGSRGVPV
ncbi:MAG: inositol monophosphatase [Geobacter sp.]|nr:inositol monophosphatase [Geobacter sp.]